MNHGIVLFQREAFESRLWEMAMACGQFIAVYAERRMQRSNDDALCDLWLHALTPITGEALSFAPLRDHPDHQYEYARYEPSYDGQFFAMCRCCTGYSGSPAVVLPASANDQEAMRLLQEFHSLDGDAWPYLQERFYVVARHKLRKPKKNALKLSSLLKPIRVGEGWAYFVGFFRSGDGVVAFLADSESDVEGLLEPVVVIRKADWLYEYGVIDKW